MKQKQEEIGIRETYCFFSDNPKQFYHANRDSQVQEMQYLDQQLPVLLHKV